MRDRRFFQGCLNPLVIIIGLIIAGILFAITLAVLVSLRPVNSPPAPVTAIVTVIPAASPTPLPVTAPPGQVTPTSAPIPTPQPGVISLEAYVEISGTGTDGLRLREEPGLQSKTLFVAIESEVFIVKDGPKDADWYTWWYLVSPTDSAHAGWAVSNYLAVVQNP